MFLKLLGGEAASAEYANLQNSQDQQWRVRLRRTGRYSLRSPNPPEIPLPREGQFRPMRVTLPRARIRAAKGASNVCLLKALA